MDIRGLWPAGKAGREKQPCMEAQCLYPAPGVFCTEVNAVRCCRHGFSTAAAPCTSTYNDYSIQGSGTVSKPAGLPRERWTNLARQEQALGCVEHKPGALTLT